MRGLTPRQTEALAWLPTVGKATTSTLRRHGFSIKTMYSLAERGLIELVYVPTGGSGGYVIFYPKAT